MRILKDEHTIYEQFNANSNSKSKMTVTSIEIENELRVWVMMMWEKRVFLSDSMIQEKARQVQCTLNAALSIDKRTSVHFSNGWLYSFQHRHNFCSLKSHGEVGNADHAAAREALPSLRQLTATFALADIFNADECGLFYNSPPQTTTGAAPVARRKRSKDRITVLFCTNADGSARLPPLVVDSSQQPRAFGGATGAALGFDYHASSKAWVNFAIFIE